MLSDHPVTLGQRTVRIDGRRTTLVMERYFLSALGDVATGHGLTVDQFVTSVAAEDGLKAIGAKVRLRIVSYYRERERALMH